MVPENVILLENRVFAGVISKDEAILNQSEPFIQYGVILRRGDTEKNTRDNGGRLEGRSCMPGVTKPSPEARKEP